MPASKTEIVLPTRLSVDSEQLQALLSNYPVHTLSVFGSVLTDDFHAGSDVDLLIELLPDVPFSYFDLLELKGELAQIFHRPVDLVEKQAINNPYRKATILRSAQKIYEAVIR